MKHLTRGLLAGIAAIALTAPAAAVTYILRFTSSTTVTLGTASQPNT